MRKKKKEVRFVFVRFVSLVSYNFLIHRTPQQHITQALHCAMPLFETHPVDENEVRAIVKEHWSLDLGKCLKASQNHTFLATRDDGSKFVVRVTPDPRATRLKAVELEVALLDFLHSNKLPVCRSIPTINPPNQKWIHSKSALIIVTFEYASGEPVNFVEWKWLTDRDHVVGLGRWFAQLHALTKRFALEHPQLCAHARKWTELHEGILAEAPIDAADLATISDPSKFGLIHGDVNVSNYFWDASIGLPQMFDWDQLQVCWFLYDLSAPIWTVITVRCGGNPVDKSPVPQADEHQLTDWLLEGYKQGGGGDVERAALQRMIALRRQLYLRFCRKAVTELPTEHPMAQFCTFMNTWLQREELAAQQQQQQQQQ